ncbi:Uma2 family endonuclease [Leptothermofonsia sichuanensis]|uniref:Uma2 family endonuclease n=1 Tax=Leptothermofonsia sichuanensis TaxID=2917832 RepID=UPI0024C07E2C|nr:Uma2 family endonuclease [Leptothermofonsia sichuanensis]
MPGGGGGEQDWHDDYARKLEDYESLGILKYRIVDYRALGGRRFIGTPKQPMVSVYGLVDGVYELAQFRMEERVRSPLFPELDGLADQFLRVEK